MSYLVFLYASGWAFFVGAAMLIAAAFVSPNRFRWATILAIVGLVVFVAPSSFAVQWRVSTVLVFVTLIWWRSKNRDNYFRACHIFVWTIFVFGESLHQLTPRIEAVQKPIKIAVIGDSLTSGLSETKATRWPELLTRRPGIDVAHDYAVEGATCRKAMAQAENVPEDANLVIVEIGGNDLLGSTTLDEFERDYDALLKKLWRDERDRTVIGFELPLPPFHNRWGESQRRIAFNHGVKLIPKWRLMWVLCDPENTVDSIHPTQAGQNAIESLVWSVLRRSLSDVEHD